MKCPYCKETNNKVVDSRLNKDRNIIRRRRECLGCEKRFTTYEHIEKIPVIIIKKDGRRETFNREKAKLGILRACEKRKISINIIESFLDELENDLEEFEEKEVPSHLIGEKIMKKLHTIDNVAYVRFASVYREFDNVHDFITEIKKFIN